MSRRLRPAADERGTSLVEVLVAVLILAIAAVALSSATVQVLTRRTEASQRSEANIIATTYLEEVRTRLVSTLASEDSVRVDEMGHPDAAGHFVRELTVEAGPVVKSRLITVTVSYSLGGNGKGSVELMTIAYEGVEQ